MIILYSENKLNCDSFRTPKIISRKDSDSSGQFASIRSLNIKDLKQNDRIQSQIKSPLNILSGTGKQSRNIFLPNIQRCIIRNNLLNTVNQASDSKKQIFSSEVEQRPSQSYKNIRSIFEKYANIHLD